MAMTLAVGTAAVGVSDAPEHRSSSSGSASAATNATRKGPQGSSVKGSAVGRVGLEQAPRDNKRNCKIKRPFLQVREQKRLYKSWLIIKENSRNSSSNQIKTEIEEFEPDFPSRLKSISSRLSGSIGYIFSASRGVAIPKSGPVRADGSKPIRPIVISPVEDRIVQRAILDVLVDVPTLKPYFLNPWSFGGLKKAEDSSYAGVPAAIDAVLSNIKGSSRFIICADISSFFTRISKSAIIKIISSACQDTDFQILFSRAINVELANMANLKNNAAYFPISDIGVAQGNCLSPLLGNIILHEFDNVMNEGDCACIRYIDDFIIMAPSKRAAKARLKRAVKVLEGLGMSLAESKTHSAPIDIRNKFEFLGIEFSNGFIRPAPKSISKFLDSVALTFNESYRSLNAANSGNPVNSKHFFINTLRRVDGMAHGWSKHYFFCNDHMAIKHTNEKLRVLVEDYYFRSTRVICEKNKSLDISSLGVNQICIDENTSFCWKDKI
jgi:retron-type reverse transcriptase